MKRYTPSQLRCGLYSCPDVFYDGKTAVIVGNFALTEALTAGAKLGTDEFAVSIPRDYLLDLARKLIDEENQRDPTGVGFQTVFPLYGEDFEAFKEATDE